MSNEGRVTPTVIYFLYSAICNLLILIHYSSVRSGRRPMANSRGKFEGTRKIISGFVAIWKINQETYRVPLLCLSLGLALHRSTDPVPMTYITRDLCDAENQIYFLSISGGLPKSSGIIIRCLWMLTPRRLPWKWRIRCARTEYGGYLENNMLWAICGSKRSKTPEHWRKMYNEEVYSLRFPLCIANMM